MMMQRTLKKKVVFTGKGLHTGRIVRMEINPASSDHGIKFMRTDVDLPTPIKAISANISSTDLCTTIGSGHNSVGTVEHLMAAFAGLGIDNALVKLNAPEVPIMDGSSRPFVHALTRAGLQHQTMQRRKFVVKETFEYRDGNRFIRMEPAKEVRILCTIDFGKGFIGQQTKEFVLSEGSFLELADARTFCHINEVNALRSMGLAQGGSLENAVVVTDHGIMNEEGLRGTDEFVRHKLLDCLGDLYLLGGQFVGKITVVRPGHSLHADFMNRVLLHRNRYFDVLGGGDRAVEVENELAFAGGVAFG